MPCFRPIQAHSEGLNAKGKRILVFNKKEASNSPSAFKIPCGKCHGCKMERARQWALRCRHEAQMHETGCFITLTYSPEHLPKDGSLDPLALTLFFKRLRTKTGLKIRYLACGEYGKKLARPHYHAILFGYHFPDRTLYKEKPFRWYLSNELVELWPYGFSTVADLTDASACYVARYTMKKVYGDQAKSHYAGKKPEFLRMSRMPGIGHDWYQKFKTDIYPKGIYTKIDGKKVMPPDYYDRQFQKEDPDGYKKLKLDRSRKAKQTSAWDTINGVRKLVPNDDAFRLVVRESIAISKLKELKRSLEDSDNGT